MIALDANLFIYMLEANPQFGKVAREIFVAIEQDGLSACASELTFMEVLSHRLLSKSDADRARKKLEKLGVSFIPVTKQTFLESARLRREYSLGAFDSIHVASALLTGSTQFVTNDQSLLKRNVPAVELVALTDSKTITRLQRDDMSTAH